MLNVLVFLPLAGGLLAALLPAGRGGRMAGWVTLLFSVCTLGIGIGLLIGFDFGTGPVTGFGGTEVLYGQQHVTDVNWIPELGIHYKLGLDGLNLFLILMTALLWVAAIAGSMPREWERPRLYYLMLALGETAVLGAFCAQDLALFVLFFDLMLVPFYFLIGIWGGPNRVRATTTFVIYTLVGSLLMLAAAAATGILATPDGGTTSFELTTLLERPLSEGSQDWIFLLFAFAFLVKMPAFPLHAWMPAAYTNAPTPVVAVLSGVLSKVGAYGFLRIALPLFPDAAAQYQDLLLVVAVASILYGSVMAFTQTSATLVVGYSSIAQLGFITLGIFSLTDEGAQGALLQMVNHGLVVVPLFFIIALLAERAGGSDDLRRMGGLALRAPVLAAVFLIVALATLAIPGSSNFAGEFLILTGAFKEKIVFAIVASLGVVLAAVYMIRLYQRSMHNPLAAGAESREMSLRDAAVILPVVAVILFLALYPQFILERSEQAVSSGIVAERLVIR
ncbi:MAG TPA: NADH-quinone oxidoreductase subunit M [Solirubrobacterales bacterium]|nr:NADH-quinone oxidoreductase subunit M [Solirubrobacterales bacterium]